LSVAAAERRKERLGSLRTMEKLREIFPQWKTASPVDLELQVFAPLRRRFAAAKAADY